MSKVKVINTANSAISVRVPDLRFSRNWPQKGSSVMIEDEMLQDLMNDQGFQYMIETGMLYIESMDAKKALGIEPDDATEPTNIIMIDDKECKKIWALSKVGFKDRIGKFNIEQLNLIADYGVANKIMDMDKSNILKKACGRDVVETIRLSSKNKENLETEE